MRKFSVLAVLAFITFTTASAQEFTFGVKGGVNLASIGGNSYGSLGGINSKVGFHIGGVVEIPISEKMAVQPELLYSLQGSKWSYLGTGNNLNLDYVNLPVMVKYYIIKGLSADAGPLVGFLLSTNADKEDFKSLEIAFGIGGSYKIGENLFAGIRYNKGVMDINNNSNLNGSNQNNVFQIFAGYAF